jgi:hypothetical protein
MLLSFGFVKYYAMSLALCYLISFLFYYDLLKESWYHTLVFISTFWVSALFYALRELEKRTSLLARALLLLDERLKELEKK